MSGKSIFPMTADRTPNPFERHLLAAVLTDELRCMQRNGEWPELVRCGATLDIDARGVARVLPATNKPLQ